MPKLAISDMKVLVFDEKKQNKKYNKNFNSKLAICNMKVLVFAKDDKKTTTLFSQIWNKLVLAHFLHLQTYLPICSEFHTL